MTGGFEKAQEKEKTLNTPREKRQMTCGASQGTTDGLFTTFDGDKRERDDVFKGSKENIPAQNSTLRKKKKHRIKAFSNA